MWFPLETHEFQHYRNKPAYKLKCGINHIDTVKYIVTLSISLIFMPSYLKNIVNLCETLHLTDSLPALSQRHFEQPYLTDTTHIDISSKVVTHPLAV